LLFSHGKSRNLQSRNGVRQGEPLSSLLFCLYIRECLADGAMLQDARPFAFIDDVHLVGPPDGLVRAFTLLQTHLTNLSLNVNASKSEFIYFHEETAPIPTHVRDFLQQHSISIQNRSAEVLGAIIGATDRDIVERLRTKYSVDGFAQSPFFRRIAMNELPAQSAMLLL